MKKMIGLFLAFGMTGFSLSAAHAESKAAKKARQLKEALSKKAKGGKEAVGKTAKQAKKEIGKAGDHAKQGTAKLTKGAGDKAKAVKDYLTEAAKQSSATAPIQPNNYRQLKTSSGASQGLHAGGLLTKWTMQWLKDKGVKTIVSLQPEGENNESRAEGKLAKGMGLKFIRFPYVAAKSLSPEESFKVVAELAKGKQAPVYLHCLLGKDRTGGLLALHRVINEGWLPNDAFKEWWKRNTYCACDEGQFDKTFNDVIAALKQKTGDAKYNFRIKSGKKDCEKSE